MIPIPGASRPESVTDSAQAADLTLPPGQDELIAYGPLLSDDSTTWLGTAALVRAPSVK